MRLTFLDEATWHARRAAHEARVDGWIADYLTRRRHGIEHPVEDFLFTYYSYRPAQLRRWHPGAGVVLIGATHSTGNGATDRDGDGATDGAAAFGRDYRAMPGGVTVDVPRLLARRGAAIASSRRLLAGTAAKAPHFGCFGMHEWAMVYRQTPHEVRHNAWPLRLGAERTAAVLEERGVRCSHFDAYRFFTPAARQQNPLRPTRDRQHEFEQPGCLHANMDLYKIAYKLSPLVPGELVAECFALARDIRVLDMRASPYDLADLGYPPVRVETTQGRTEYAAAQRAFAQRAAPLRGLLIAAIDAVTGMAHSRRR